jgi:hypothetical protein
MRFRLDMSRLVRLGHDTYQHHDDLIVQVPVQSALSVAKTVDLPDGQPQLVASQVDAITGEHQLVVVKSTVYSH